MLLSVIIPAYNAQRYLEEAVRSVLDQTCETPKILIVNDGSEDRTGQIAAGLAREYPTVRVIHTQNGGAAHARNVGLAAATGAYVAFLDADDVWCAGAVDSETDRLLMSGSYDILSFGYINAEPGLCFGRFNPEEPGLLMNGEPDYNRAASRKSFCSYILRRSLLDTIRFPEGICYNEDTTFLFLATRAARNILRLDRYLFVYRNNIHSAMHASEDWRYILTDEIPAWNWAGKQAACEKDRQDCDGMIYSLMWEYVRLSAMWGAAASDLQEDVRQCLPFREVLNRFGSFWTRPETVDFHSCFSRDPKRLCRMCRMRGLLPRTARTLARKQPLRRLYLRMKYRTPLTGYVAGRNLCGRVDAERNVV